MKDGRASVQALTSEKKQLLEDADELMARKAALEVTVGDLEARVEEESNTKVGVVWVWYAHTGGRGRIWRLGWRTAPNVGQIVGAYTYVLTHKHAIHASI